MDFNERRDVLNKIIAACDELREVALSADQKMIAHLLQMVVVQAKQSKADNGKSDRQS